MIRQTNPVDFWRGLALVFIFINHIPGNYFSKFTHAHYSISDSADLFVFLAGWALRHLVGSGDRSQPMSYVALRLGGRAVTLYAAQVMITMIALAMLAGVAIWRNNPLLLEWHNAAAVFYDPVPAHIGLALLTHQLGYFDILPLYVVLMAMAPMFAIVDRYAPNLVLPLSLTIYVVALIFQIAVPTWPVDGRWFFNPLAWQFVFVLGFVLARPDGIGGYVRRHIGTIRLIAIPIVIAGVAVTVMQWWPDPTRVPQPRLFFIFSKTFMTPPRLIQFLALVAVMSVTYPYIIRYARRLVEFLALLGRNSLYVFCAGSLLSLGGQILRYIYRGDLIVDTLVVAIGIAIMALVAWLPEWRERLRTRPAARPVGAA